MTLLKGDGSLPPKTEPKVTITRWPTERWPEGLGVSVRDGWNFGLGLGPALIVIIIISQIIFVGLGCMALMAMGTSLGALL
jgi:hypothetical protein